MTTTSATWFYRPPEKRPYLIAERLRTSLWDQRLGALWLEVESAEAPCRASGSIDATTVRLEWQPAEWLRLAVRPADDAAVHAMNNLLGRRPALRYLSPDGETVLEWWIRPEAAERRWQEIQGNPRYGKPERLRA